MHQRSLKDQKDTEKDIFWACSSSPIKCV